MQLQKEIALLVKERNSLKDECQTLEASTSQFRVHLQKQEVLEKDMPARIAKALEEGRRVFLNFDAFAANVNLDQEALHALLASANGPEIVYAAGIGMGIIRQHRQIQAEEDYRRQQLEHYREAHRQHFAETQAN